MLALPRHHSQNTLHFLHEGKAFPALNWWKSQHYCPMSPPSPIRECLALTEKNARLSANGDHTEQVTPPMVTMQQGSCSAWDTEHNGITVVTVTTSAILHFHSTPADTYLHWSKLDKCNYAIKSITEIKLWVSSKFFFLSNKPLLLKCLPTFSVKFQLKPTLFVTFSPSHSITLNM